MKSRKPYPQEFTVEAVRLVTEQGLTPHKVARDLGVDPETMRRWMRELAPPPESATNTSSAVSVAELARLRREVEQLRQERAILKKAIGIFSRMPQ